MTFNFQTNRPQSPQREIIKDIGANTTEESIDQSEYGDCEKDAIITSHTSVLRARSQPASVPARGNSSGLRV